MILDLVSSETRFTKFNEAIKTAGLTERCSSPNNFTVFAPTNEAFDELPQEQILAVLKPANREYLRRLLLLHVIPGALLAQDLKQAEAVKTEGGQTFRLNVSEDLNEIRFADAQVIMPQIKARNGILYPLDTVLMPTVGAVAMA
jgi:uncharacterized surface protein with fasciclin (FAS1) repeats